MKKVKIEKFKASDGSLHDTEAECLKHEAETKPLAERLHAALLNSPTMIEGAMAYRPNARGAAALIEECAKICATARIAAGGAKRKTKGKSDGAPKVGEGVHQEPASQSSPARTEALAPGRIPAPRPTADNPFPIHAAAKAESAAE